MDGSDVLVVLQAAATAVSAVVAAYLAYLTVRRDREVRAERQRDLEHEQRRRLVDGLRTLERVMSSGGYQREFDVARAEISAALALRDVSLPASEALLDEGMPVPPYNMGQHEGWQRLERALAEARHLPSG